MSSQKTVRGAPRLGVGQFFAVVGWSAGTAAANVGGAFQDVAIRIRSALSAYRLGRWRIASDIALIVSVGLWALALGVVNIRAMGVNGLPGILPIVWFIALGLLLVSFGSLLTDEHPSRVRVGLHLIVLLLILYGTAPFIYAVTRYSWLYKHVGVTQYIATHGSLNTSIDIYQNWPGFFALAAWFDKVAGFINPLSYAAWAQLAFEFLYVLELGWALKATSLSERERWLALFIFACGNWIAQDYFSPQGLGLALSLGVFGIALHTLQPRRQSRSVLILEEITRRIVNWPTVHLLRRPEPVAQRDARSQIGSPTAATFVCLMLVYFVLTAVHELSPYIVVEQLGLLALFGAIRPRVVIIGMLVIVFGYLAPRFTYVNDHYGILSSFDNFFGNAQPPSASHTTVATAQKFTEDSGALLSAWIWGLSVLGIVRRIRHRRPAFGLALLTFSPIPLLAVVAYGNEGILRIFLFSLPWAACLVASAICVAPRRHRQLRWLIPPAFLTITATLFILAFFGGDDANALTTADVKAATFLYNKTVPGPIMSVDFDFPGNISARYPLYPDSLAILGGGLPNAPQLGAKSVPFATQIMREYGAGSVTPGYIIISPAMIGYAEDYALATPKQFRVFEQALSRDPAWHVIYRSGGALIYELPAIAPGTQH